MKKVILCAVIFMSFIFAQEKCCTNSFNGLAVSYDGSYGLGYNFSLSENNWIRIGAFVNFNNKETDFSYDQLPHNDGNYYRVESEENDGKYYGISLNFNQNISNFGESRLYIGFGPKYIINSQNFKTIHKYNYEGYKYISEGDYSIYEFSLNATMGYEYIISSKVKIFIESEYFYSWIWTESNIKDENNTDLGVFTSTFGGESDGTKHGLNWCRVGFILKL